MDPLLLAEGIAVGKPLDWRVQLTIPSILAAGEEFRLRVTFFDPQALPSGALEESVVFEEAAGVEGLPTSVKITPEERGRAEIGPLKATAGPVAQVGATVAGHPVISNPAWVFDEPAWRLYWGDLHVHTTHSNCQQWACKSPEFALSYARNPAALDFAAAADHTRGLVAEAGRWAEQQALVERWNQPGRFVPLLAQESSHRSGYGGDNNIYFAGADGGMFWVDRQDMRGNNPEVPIEELWEQLDAAGKPYITVPHHTGRAGKYRTFDDGPYNPRREPLFEIYSAWGSSERRHTSFPLHAGNTDKPAYFVDALKAGCRYGVIASSDDHTTLPGGESRNWGTPFGPRALSGYHHQGLAAVRTSELTRKGIWDGLTHRRTYGTTFDRSLLDVTIGELEMGQEGRVDASDPLRKQREVKVRVSLPAGRGRAVLLRNGEEIDRKPLRQEGGLDEVTFTDETPLAEVAIRAARFHPEPFVVYYVRIEGPQRETQWSSPIWLDL